MLEYMFLLKNVYKLSERLEHISYFFLLIVPSLVLDME